MACKETHNGSFVLPLLLRSALEKRGREGGIVSGDFALGVDIPPTSSSSSSSQLVRRGLPSLLLGEERRKTVSVLV